jgi:hypothetical protein
MRRRDWITTTSGMVAAGLIKTRLDGDAPRRCTTRSWTRRL